MDHRNKMDVTLLDWRKDDALANDAPVRVSPEAGTVGEKLENSRKEWRVMVVPDCERNRGEESAFVKCPVLCTGPRRDKR